jgi:outer membrane cobalamin receptor
MDPSGALLILLARWVESGGLQPGFQERIVVTASRVEQRAGEVPANVTVLTREDVERSPARTLDDLLRQVPGFSLFRRSSSLTAHPTTQGVSLRGIGPSGSSRTLVLVDGVPLNDPFGGWVAWSRVPLESVEQVEVVRGGGANLWGSAAMGGVIHVLTAPPEARTLRALAEVGNRDTLSGSVLASHRTGRLGFSLSASAFDTAGSEVVRRDQRAPIDVPASSENRVLSGRLEAAAGPVLLTLNAGLFEEERGSGTPLTGSSTDTRHASLGAAFQSPGGHEWQVSAFARDQTFRSAFSSQAPDRASETPSLDQFDVPADELGAGAQWLRPSARHLLTAGADVRRVRGEAREDFRFVGGRFTARRAAGGEQQLAGLWLQEIFTPSPAWQVTLGGRIDSWRTVESFRRERSLETGEALRDEAFADRDDLFFNPKLGVRYRMSDRLALRGSLYRGFRAPTLNEQFRPFRVRNDITEANAGLVPERLTGAELGMDAGSARSSGRLTGYWNEVKDPVANVTVGFGPGVVAPCGFVPAGGVCRQRRNLGSARIVGLEAEARHRPHPFWEVGASWLWSEADLQGKRLAQVPRHQAVLWIAYDKPGAVALSAQGRFVGSQFEDDLNTLGLRGFTVLDLAASRRLRKGWEVFVGIENAFGETVEAGRTAEGLVTVGTPRLLHLAIRFLP